MKFDDRQSDEPFDYGDVYQVTSNDDTHWIMAGISRNQIALVEDLSRALPDPFHLMYVATELSQRVTPGRYDAAHELSRTELTAFLSKYRNAFEQDGRHALWIGGSNGLLVFTPHDIVYCYGPVDSYEQILRRRHFVQRNFSIPGPHFHFYDGNFDAIIDEMIAEREWHYSKLEPIDEET